MTNRELDCFSEGYILGRNKAGNLKPLQVTENGIYYPADYKCGGFNKVEVNVSIQNNLIDKLPTWGEVIINEEYSIKIKHSDEIEDDNSYTIANYYSNIPYLYMLSKYWTYYFCVYKNNQLVFGNKVKTHSSRQWSWSMWNSDTQIGRAHV